MSDMRCGFGKRISPEDQAKIDELFQSEAEDKQHVHVWCNWLRCLPPGSGFEFRECLNCGEREHRWYVQK